MAEAYVAVNGHADIIYMMHRTMEAADRDLAAAEMKGDSDRVEWLRQQRDSLA